jgi:hypothetical protein
MPSITFAYRRREEDARRRPAFEATLPDAAQQKLLRCGAASLSNVLP